MDCSFDAMRGYCVVLSVSCWVFGQHRLHLRAVTDGTQLLKRPLQLFLLHLQAPLGLWQTHLKSTPQRRAGFSGADNQILNGSSQSKDICKTPIGILLFTISTGCVAFLSFCSNTRQLPIEIAQAAGSTFLKRPCGKAWTDC